MHKINTSTAVNGEFADGNPATGQKATELNAAWFATIQRELLAFLIDAGVAPDLQNDSQLLSLFPTNGAWKSFFPSSEIINVENWKKNSVVLPSIWSAAFGYNGSSIKNAAMIVFPRWDLAGSEESCTYTHSVPNHIDMSVSIPRGNILFVIFNENGAVARAYCMPASSSDSIAIFKTLVVEMLTGSSLEITGIFKALSSGITMLKHLYLQKDTSVSGDIGFFSDDALTTNVGSFNHSTGLWILWQLLVVGNATIGGALGVTGSVSSKNNIHPKSDTTVSTNVQTTGFITTSIIKMNADITILPNRVHNLGEHFIFVNSKIGQLLHVTYWNGVETKTSAIEMETSREFMCISEAADDLILLPMDGFI